MSADFFQPIEVETRRDRPRRITYAGSSYRVLQMLDYRVVQGPPWDETDRRTYFRVRTNKGIMEMCRANGAWRLVGYGTGAAAVPAQARAA